MAGGSDWEGELPVARSSRSERATWPGPGGTLAGMQGGTLPLLAGGRPSRTMGNGLCPNAEPVLVCPLTFARPAVTSREQRVRRRAGGQGRIRGAVVGRAGSVASKESPHCQVSASPVSGRGAGKRNFWGWLASRRQIRRRSEYLRRMPTICRP